MNQWQLRRQLDPDFKQSEPRRSTGRHRHQSNDKGVSTAQGSASIGSVPAMDRAPRIEPRNLPASILSQKLAQPITAGSVSRSVLDSSLLGAIGAKRVIVRLSAESAASALVKGADTAQAKWSARAQQDAFLIERTRARPERAGGGPGAGRHERRFHRSRCGRVAGAGQ